MGAPSGALQLRLLQTVSEVASDQNSTLVMPLPMEMLRFFEQATGAAAEGASLPSTPPTSTLAAVPADPAMGATRSAGDRIDGDGDGAGR
jgi:hypothetical protein